MSSTGIILVHIFDLKLRLKLQKPLSHSCSLLLANVAHSVIGDRALMMNNQASKLNTQPSALVSG